MLQKRKKVYNILQMLSLLVEVNNLISKYIFPSNSILRFEIVYEKISKNNTNQYFYLLTQRHKIFVNSMLI